MEKKLEWTFDEAEGSWWAESAINPGFASPYEYHITMNADGMFCVDKSDPVLGVIGFQNSLPEAKRHCQNIEHDAWLACKIPYSGSGAAPVEQAAREGSDDDLPRPGIINPNMTKVPSEEAVEARELLGKSGLKLTTAGHTTINGKHKDMFFIDRVPPAPERRDYAQEAIDEYFGSLSSVKTIVSEEGRYMVRSAVASYSEDVEKLIRRRINDKGYSFEDFLRDFYALLPK